MTAAPNEQTKEDAPVGSPTLDGSAVEAAAGTPSDEPNAPAGDRPEPTVASPADHVPEISQSDIDALMEAAGDSGRGSIAAPAASPAPPPDAPTDTLEQTPDEAARAVKTAVDEEPGESAAADRRAPAGPPSTAASPATEPFEFREVRAPEGLNLDPKRMNMLSDVNLRVRIELGRTRMLVEDVLKLDEGSVVELDKLAGDPVDVFVNDRLTARGEVLVLNDSFCVRINEVLAHDPHRVIV